VIPLAALLAGLVDFAISFAVLLGLMVFFGIFPTVAVLALPLFLALALMSALGVGLWLSALNVQYRDVRYTIPFLAQLWLFATPVAYPSSLLPERWRLVLALNPMAGVVEAFRWALLGTSNAPGWMAAISALIVVGALVGGLYYFRRMERRFADFV
jgi:lipopolysaccharide transport system permease protein